MSTVLAPALETPETDEVLAVLRWRFSQLAEAGFALEDAVILATEPQIDLHEAVGLVERGCPPETAFRILT